MKFVYPELETTSFNGRWYHTPDGAYPSITTILGATVSPEKRASLKRWQDELGAEAVAITDEAARRGTVVHLLVERYLKNQDVLALIDGEEVRESDLRTFNVIRPELDQITEVWGQECCLYSSELELAGRCDLIAIYRGVPTIIDFKTSRRVKQHDDVNDYKLQLAFYGKAHNELLGTTINDGLILMASAAGFPQRFKVKLTEHLPDLQRRARAFWDQAVNTII